jgi:hypothetical protein
MGCLGRAVTNRDFLNKRILVLRLIADCYEDRGDEVCSLACRWLIRINKGFPFIKTLFNWERYKNNGMDDIGVIPEIIFSNLDNFRYKCLDYWVDYITEHDLVISLGNALKKCGVSID